MRHLSWLALDSDHFNWSSLAFRLFLCIAVVACGLGVGSAQVQVPVEFGPDGSVIPPDPPRASPPAKPIPGRYIVKFTNGASPAARAAAAREIGAQVVHNFAFSSTIAIIVPNENALNGLRNSRAVLWIVPDQLLAFAAPPGVKAPENLIATPSGSDVTLTWTQKEKVDTFTVERCDLENCLNFGEIASGLPKDQKSYTDSGTTGSGLPDGDYRYRVIAEEGGAFSPPSNIADATVGPPPPPPLPPDGSVRGTQQVLTYAVQRVGRPVEGSTGLGIGVAIVDSGIDFFHTDLAPAPDDSGLVLTADTSTGTSFNADSPGTSCQDFYSYGTHVSGLTGARDNNGGMVGVAPDATLYCVKIDLNATPGVIPLSNLQAGLEWVLASHDRVVPNIKVVNLSLAVGPPAGGPDPARAEIDNLIQLLYAAGVATVASAGNDPLLTVFDTFPANVPNVISAAGTTATIGLNICTDTLEWVGADTVYAGGNGDPGTTDGVDVTISAPAEERHDLLPGGLGCTAFLYGTLSTSLTQSPCGPSPLTTPCDLITRKLPTPGGPFEARGTSFSAALVSGVMARIYQAELDAGNLNGNSGDVDGARTTLVDTADRIGVAPIDHPWVGFIPTFLQSVDGVYEGIAQAPLPDAVP